ncbi:hypothetical protein MP228_010333 [Amoeboaphelidium protococcarum]|nr:hypothetical protein MP228_010333 [Amoeboaphelidium protococcarum]
MERVLKNWVSSYQDQLAGKISSAVDLESFSQEVDGACEWLNDYVENIVSGHFQDFTQLLQTPATNKKKNIINQDQAVQQNYDSVSVPQFAQEQIPIPDRRVPAINGGKLFDIAEASFESVVAKESSFDIQQQVPKRSFDVAQQDDIQESTGVSYSGSNKSSNNKKQKTGQKSNLTDQASHLQENQREIEKLLSSSIHSFGDQSNNSRGDDNRSNKSNSKSRYEEAHPASDILSFTASEDDASILQQLDGNVLPGTLEVEKLMTVQEEEEEEEDEQEQQYEDANSDGERDVLNDQELKLKESVNVELLDETVSHQLQNVSAKPQSSQSSQKSSSKNVSAKDNDSQKKVKSNIVSANKAGQFVDSITKVARKVAVNQGNSSSNSKNNLHVSGKVLSRPLGNPVKTAAQRREEEEQARQAMLRKREEDKAKRMEAALEAKRKEEELVRKKNQERQAKVLQNKEAAAKLQQSQLQSQTQVKKTLKGTTVTVSNAVTGKTNLHKTKQTPAKRSEEQENVPQQSPALDPQVTILNKKNGKYVIPHIPSDDEYESDDGYALQKKASTRLPQWANSPNLRKALRDQHKFDPDALFGTIPPIKMESIFSTSKSISSFRVRTSSANWSQDKLTMQEMKTYRMMMGFSAEPSSERKSG